MSRGTFKPSPLGCFRVCLNEPAARDGLVTHLREAAITKETELRRGGAGAPSRDWPTRLAPAISSHGKRSWCTTMMVCSRPFTGGSMRFPLGGFELKRLVLKMVSDLENVAVLSLQGYPKRYGTRSFKIGSMSTLYFAGASEEELWRNDRHALVAANRHIQTQPHAGRRPARWRAWHIGSDCPDHWRRATRTPRDRAPRAALGGPHYGTTADTRTFLCVGDDGRTPQLERTL